MVDTYTHSGSRKYYYFRCWPATQKEELAPLVTERPRRNSNPLQKKPLLPALLYIAITMFCLGIRGKSIKQTPHLMAQYEPKSHLLLSGLKISENI